MLTGGRNGPRGRGSCAPCVPDAAERDVNARIAPTKPPRRCLVALTGRFGYYSELRGLSEVRGAYCSTTSCLATILRMLIRA